MRNIVGTAEYPVKAWLRGGRECVPEEFEELVTEGSVYRHKFFILKTCLVLLPEEPLPLNWWRTRRDGGIQTWVIWEDEGKYADEGILRIRKDEDEVFILDPSKGTLNQCQVRRQDVMSFLNAGIVRFCQIIWEGRGWEVVDDGIDRDDGQNIYLSANFLGDQFNLKFQVFVDQRQC